MKAVTLYHVWKDLSVQNLLFSIDLVSANSIISTNVET